MYQRMKLICCDVLFRMACRAAAVSKNIIDIEFTRLQSHVDPDLLRKEIQGLIDKADAEDVYEYILLGYGLCGNSTAGLTARTRPLVIPRAHDCCTLFLGSREKFENNFSARLSAQWSSHGYLERNHDYLGGTDLYKGLGMDKEYAELVEKYGEENAEYIWETLHPAHNVGKDERIYIDVAPFDSPDDDHHFKRYEDAVAKEGVEGEEVKEGNESEESDIESSSAKRTALDGIKAAGRPITRLKGSTRLIDLLLEGDWGDDFLIVQPGMSIAAVYDMEQVVSASAR